jgi:hypothetical protein
MEKGGPDSDRFRLRGFARAAIAKGAEAGIASGRHGSTIAS